MCEFLSLLLLFLLLLLFAPQFSVEVVACCLLSSAFSFLCWSSCCSGPPQKKKGWSCCCCRGRGGRWLLACKAVLFPSPTEVVLVAWPPPKKKQSKLLLLSEWWGRNLISALLCFLASFSCLFLRGETCCPAPSTKKRLEWLLLWRCGGECAFGPLSADPLFQLDIIVIVTGGGWKKKRFHVRPRKRICALGFERPRRKCTCVFYHNHSKVEKNDFPQLRTLKKELCMHFRTPRCCSLFPVTWLLLKRLSCNVCRECIQLATFHRTVLAKRKKGVKSREFRLLTPRKKS